MVLRVLKRKYEKSDLWGKVFVCLSLVTKKHILKLVAHHDRFVSMDDTLFFGGFFLIKVET